MADKKIALDQGPKRRIFDVKWEEGQVVTHKVSNDTCLVGIHINIKGSFVHNFTGTPSFRAEGAMDSLINYIEFVDDRQGQVKYLRPHFLHMQQISAMGTPSRRLFSVGATENLFPTTEGAPQPGTTGQVVSIDESVYLPFEHVYCEPGGFGRETTYFNTRRSTSTVLKFHCGNMARLVANAGGGITFANQKFTIQVSYVERTDFPENVVFDLWRQIQKSEPFSGQVFDKEIEVNTGTKLSGLALYTVDGSAAKAATNKLIRKLALQKNSRGAEQEIGFNTLQDANRIEYGIEPKWVNGANRMDGFAHLTQISRRDMATALDTSKEGGTSTLKLKIDTNDSSLVDYTSPATLYIVTEEVVPPKV
ncbi:hypothetical protein AZI87_12005 [Bdellovibrio bacteriovorus]|uniref:Uncharacterized protein n=1 Tax=Bdellovibrio bacteriovorus TaxID=959 RepID=A0A162G8D7_BDEBC|nr:hypothetical protein [Bdellovibrio bacteriovorus]KYG65272.1 hypothetical protein AZI87_12005 [Bdellovibrio bacteriovorus]